LGLILFTYAAAITSDAQDANISTNRALIN